MSWKLRAAVSALLLAPQAVFGLGLGDIRVNSALNEPLAAEIELVYKMEKNGNVWIVVDMETDGVSLLSNYRSQFNQIIKKDGWENMMKKMKDKLAE